MANHERTTDLAANAEESYHLITKAHKKAIDTNYIFRITPRIRLWHDDADYFLYCLDEQLLQRQHQGQIIKPDANGIRTILKRITPENPHPSDDVLDEALALIGIFKKGHCLQTDDPTAEKFAAIEGAAVELCDLGYKQKRFGQDVKFNPSRRDLRQWEKKWKNHF